MKTHKSLLVAGRDEWRVWLAGNHETEKGVWLIYFKAHTGEGGISYEESVNEALCFGWIDGLIRRVDDRRYARLFTPRIDNRNWSEINRQRVTRLIAEGRMTAAGLAKIDYLETGKTESAKTKRTLVLPDDLRRTLQANRQAWENFNRLAPYCRRQYIGWITTAKKEETRHRRLEEAISLLAQNKKLGLK